MSTTASDNRVVTTVADIRAKLAAQLPIAKRYDAEVVKAHKAAEAAWLAGFRDALKALAKLDYAQVSSRSNRYLDIYQQPTPDCPRLVAPWIESLIAQFDLDSRDGAVHVDPNGAVGQALTWRPGGYPQSAC